MRIQDGLNGFHKNIKHTNCGYSYTAPSGKQAYCEAPTEWIYVDKRGHIEYSFYRCDQHALTPEPT